MPNRVQPKDEGRTPATVSTALVAKLDILREVVRSQSDGELNNATEAKLHLDSILDVALEAFLNSATSEIEAALREEGL